MRRFTLLILIGWLFCQSALAQSPAPTNPPPTFAIGDVVFIQIDNYVFRKVGETSDSWVNHVGMIVEHDGKDFIIAESTLPRAKLTPMQKFTSRSKDGRYVVRRLPQPLTEAQQTALREQAMLRLGRLYHTGFKMDSERQFCSKMVYEVSRDALGIEIGEVETFRDLLNKNPQADMVFWRTWFGGFIPWSRTMVTLASELASPALVTVYDSASPAPLEETLPPPVS